MRVRRQLDAWWLIILGVVAYANSLLNPFIWDDEQFIYKNLYVLRFDIWRLLGSSITEGAGIISNYYRPVTALSFAIDHLFWGLQPLGYHLTNLLWHLISGVLLFWLLQQLFALWQYRPRWPIAWLIAAAFVVHPIQTEAVTYINSRGDSLFAAGVCWAALWLVVSLRHQAWTILVNQHKLKLTTTMQLSLSLAGLVWATLSKEIGLTGAALLWLLLGSAWIGRRTQPHFNKLKYGVYLALSSVWVALYLTARATWLNFGSSFDFYQGSGLYAQSLVVRLLTFSKVIWVYLRLLFAPLPLHMEREVTLVTSWFSPWPWISLGLGLLLLGLGWWQWRQHRQVWTWLGLGWSLIFLAPVSGLVPINGVLYEHWLYLPATGWWLLVLTTGESLWPRRWDRAAAMMAGGILLVWIGLTWRQNYWWGDPVRFYRYTLQYAESARLHNNLAMALVDTGQLSAAHREYLRALELGEYPQTHYNIANLLLSQGDVAGARAHLERGLVLSPDFELLRLKLESLPATTSAATTTSAAMPPSSK